MAKCSCYIYPQLEDKNRDEFIALLAKEADWDREKTPNFFATNEMVVFQDIVKERAISLIQKFGAIGVITSIGSLGKPYQKKFKKFLNGYKPNWNWFAAIFSWLWLLFKGLLGKIAVYAMAVWLLSIIIPWEIWAYLSFFIGFIYFGIFGSYDYYLKKAKGEPCCTWLPYQRLKLPFWIVFIAFLGYVLVYPPIYVGTRIANMTQQSISRFATDGFSFEFVPSSWRVFENPPASFSVEVSRPNEQREGGFETLSYAALPGTKLIGFIQKQDAADPKKSDYLGIIALIERKSNFWNRFEKTNDPKLERIAAPMVLSGNRPFFMKWTEKWFPTPKKEISYEEIAGREWGRFLNILEIKAMGMEIKFYTTAYWTVLDKPAIFVISEAFSPHKDEVHSQVRQFLQSLKTQ